MSNLSRKIRRHFNKQKRVLDIANDKLYTSLKSSKIAKHQAWLHATKGWKRRHKNTLAIAAMSPAERWSLLIAPMIRRAQKAVR